MPKHSAPPSLNAAVPIRDIARITGINSITLRAWERRYGLLKPIRNHKGHRLYSLQDIERVQEIQTWLDRGLAISKVCDILSHKEDAGLSNFDSAWVDNSVRVIDALFHFNRIELERIFEELFSLYPAYILADRLMPLVLGKINKNQPLQASQYRFLNAVLVEHLHRVQYCQRKTAKGARILVLPHLTNEASLLPLLFNYSLLVNEYQSEYLGYLDVRQATLSVAALHCKLVVIAGYDYIDAAELQSFVRFWQAKCKQPLLLLGTVASLYRSSIQKSLPEGATPKTVPAIFACETQQHAIAVINQLALD